MNADKRLHPRKPLSSSARIRLKGGNMVTAKTADISLGGICIISPEPLPEGAMCLDGFEVPLNGNHRRVDTIAKVVCSSNVGQHGFRTGMRFVEVGDSSASAICAFVGLPVT